MTEKEIMELLSKASEDIEIPKALLPENIEMKLKKEAKTSEKIIRRSRWIRSLSEIAAVFCLLILGSTIYSQYHRSNKASYAEVSDSVEMQIETEAYAMQEAMDMSAAEETMMLEDSVKSMKVASNSESPIIVETYQKDEEKILIREAEGCSLEFYDISDQEQDLLLGSLYQEGIYDSSFIEGEYLYLFTRTEDNLVISACNINEPDHFTDSKMEKAGIDLQKIQCKDGKILVGD